jgi:hypothetical protein
MEELTMKQLEERQAAERAELRTKLDKKLIKENLEKMNEVGKNIISLSSFIKQTLDFIESNQGDVISQKVEDLERNVEYIKSGMQKIRDLKHQVKIARRNIKNRKEGKYEL